MMRTPMLVFLSVFLLTSVSHAQPDASADKTADRPVKVVGPVTKLFQEAMERFREKNKFRNSKDPMVLFEGNSCDQNTVGSLPASKFEQNLTKDGDHFDNDEARSLAIDLERVKAKTKILLCDDSSGSHEDDCTEITILETGKRTICVNSFETAGTYEGVQVKLLETAKRDNLDGKVSYVKVTPGS